MFFQQWKMSLKTDYNLTVYGKFSCFVVLFAIDPNNAILLKALPNN